MAWQSGEKHCPDPGAGVHSAAALALLVILMEAAAASAAPQLVIEPGRPGPQGNWLLPVGVVDDTGAPIDFNAGDLRLRIGESRVERFDLLGPDDAPTARAVLVAGRRTPPEIVPIVADALRAGGNGLRIDGWFAVDDGLQTVQALGAEPPSAATVDHVTPGLAPGRLWDPVLEVLRRLDAAGGEPVRRVLLLIADGGEDLPSEHPLATCVDAALRARIAVHVLILDGDEDGAARLRELARRTGGRAATFRSGADLKRFLRAADGVRTVRIPAAAGAAALPAEVQVEVVLAGGLTGRGEITAPEALGGPGWWIFVLLAAAAGGVIAGGFLLWWVPRRSAGSLRVRYHDGRTLERPLPRAGLTIGKKPDNGLVIEDGRVSGHHAVIRVRGSEVILTDLRSTNGTTVNDQPVRTARLGDGDRILLGQAVELIWRRGAKRRPANGERTGE